VAVVIPSGDTASDPAQQRVTGTTGDVDPELAPDLLFPSRTRTFLCQADHTA
jgi:hypothetical protein